MIGAEQIERAEKVLQVVYKADTLDRQLTDLQVDPDAFDNFITELRVMMHARYTDLDPRLLPAINTLFGHGFLVGVICGRAAAKEIV